MATRLVGVCLMVLALLDSKTTIFRIGYHTQGITKRRPFQAFTEIPQDFTNRAPDGRVAGLLPPLE